MFKTIDGRIFNASDEEDFVAKLHAYSRAPARNDKRFMNEAAYRATVQTGFIVRDDHPTNFVDDLIAAGLVEEITAH